jgi:hypothetical protein
MRVLALVCAAVAARAAAGEPAAPRYFRMKLVKVVDSRGFERPLTALTLLVPTDWTVQGSVSYDAGAMACTGLPRVSFRVASPDGRVAVEGFPATSWSWSDSPGALRAMEQRRQMGAQFGMPGCDVRPPLLARDFLSSVLLPAARPGARVLGVDVDPEAQKAVQEMARDVESRMSASGVPTRISADTARLHISHERAGSREEEWVTAMTVARATPAPSFDPMTGQMVPSLSYSCGADYIFAASAPPGRLQANESLFRAIVGSLRVDPVWLARVRQVQVGIAAAQVKGAAERSRIIARSAEETDRIMTDTWRHRQESQDRSAERWSQAMRGVETFRDPETGETVDLSHRYGNAWSNGKNEYLLSDSPGFDPGTVSRDRWRRLQPVEPGAAR